MLINDVAKLIEAEFVYDSGTNWDIHSACACDLMSDVLAFVKEQGLLLTGLNNPQVIRTAEMMDMKAVVFVRGKEPDPDVVELAKEKEISLLATDLTMYVCAGKLYQGGLGCPKKEM